MSTLRIYFSGSWRDTSSPCPWALCDETGAVLQSGNDPLSAMPKGKECIAIAAPDRVLSVGVRLPPGPRRRWQAALPFVAEEHTLPDPEDNHVVPSRALADGRTMLAIVDKPWLGRIVEACRTANLPLRRMTPETFLLALAPGVWTLVWDGSSGFVRTGSANGMALDNGDMDTAPLVLRLSLNSAQAALPEKIEVRFPQHVPEARRILPQWNGLPSAISAGPAWDWRREPIPADALNLLWGDFAPRARISEWWPKLRPAALILLAALGVEAIGANIEWAMPVSYTHLDVYKRQSLTRAWWSTHPCRCSATSPNCATALACRMTATSCRCSTRQLPHSPHCLRAACAACTTNPGGSTWISSWPAAAISGSCGNACSIRGSACA